MTTTDVVRAPCQEAHCHRPRHQAREPDDPRGDDGLCHLVLGWGTIHKGYGPCRKHGGNLPNIARAAFVAMLDDDLATFGLPTDVNAIEALTKDMRNTDGTLEYLRLKMQAMTDEELWGPAGRAVRDEYARMQKHLVEVSAALTRGETEKLVARYVGQQTDLLEHGLAWLLTRLGVWEGAETQELLDVLLLSLASGRIPQLERGDDGEDR